MAGRSGLVVPHLAQALTCEQASIKYIKDVAVQATDMEQIGFVEKFPFSRAWVETVRHMQLTRPRSESGLTSSDGKK